MTHTYKLDTQKQISRKYKTLISFQIISINAIGEILLLGFLTKISTGIEPRSMKIKVVDNFKKQE